MDRAPSRRFVALSPADSCNCCRFQAPAPPCLWVNTKDQGGGTSPGSTQSRVLIPWTGCSPLRAGCLPEMKHFKARVAPRRSVLCQHQRCDFLLTLRSVVSTLTDASSVWCGLFQGLFFSFFSFFPKQAFKVFGVQEAWLCNEACIQTTASSIDL